jgi:hypothetical protein
MGKTTKGTQTATQDRLRKIQRAGAGGSSPPTPAPLPPNAFLGKSERVPEVAYIRERPGDGFLTSAKDFYRFFGLNVRDVSSIAEIVTHLSQQSGTYQRLLLASHAHPRGIIIPMFTNGVVGTNKEVFRAFARSDLDGLKELSPFDPSHQHLQNWENIMGQCLTAARSHNSAVLAPFGLQANGIPSGELRDFFKYCFDVIFALQPGKVKRNAASGNLTNPQRTILINFIGEILTQLGQRLVNAGTGTAPQIQALRTGLTGIPYNTLGLSADAFFQLGLNNDNMNDFPTLQAAVVAIQGGFRSQLNTARQRLNENTILDIRGCRAGEDEEYIEAVREFFGRTGHLPTVTAPLWFQSYRSLAWQSPTNRAQVTSWLGSSQWGHSVEDLKAKFTAWAELIRVKPLHVDFWKALLSGRAIRFAALGWRSEIPNLFIPAPGLDELGALNFAAVIGKLKDHFNVPAAAVPSNSVLTALTALTAALPTYNQSLLATVSSSTPAAQLQLLYGGLRTINDAQGQSIVPPTAPVPLTVAQIQQYQQGLITFLETTPLAPIKAFMTAAVTSLNTGDGLYYYLLFAGLPVYVFGRPQFSQNGLVMLSAHRDRALQAWYKCLWSDPLPSSGTFSNARLNQDQARAVPMLVAEDRTSVLSVCPLPRYTNCIRKRPLPAGASDPPCDGSDLP